MFALCLWLCLCLWFSYLFTEQVEVNFVMDLLELLFVSTSAENRLPDALMGNHHVCAKIVCEKTRLLLTAYAEPWHAELMTSLKGRLCFGKLNRLYCTHQSKTSTCRCRC